MTTSSLSSTTWTTKLTAPAMAAVLQQAIRDGVADGAPAIVFHDLGRMRERVRMIQRAFPDRTLHALAIKANPLVEVLREVVKLGAGLEAASMEEVYCGLAAGCPPPRIVYNSPAKRKEDLAEALRLGVHINADTLDELARIDALRSSMETTSAVSLRINPLVGSGTIAITSVAKQDSKFGVPIASEQAITEAFQRYPWLTGLHVHVGSQGCRIELLVEAAHLIAELRERIHAALPAPRIANVNVGGGLPWSYRDGEEPPALERYVDLLRTTSPALFADDVTLITEFGRSVQAGCGWAASRVEYVKHDRDEPFALVHLGADFLMRTAYHPQDWPHRFTVLTPDGEVKTGDERPQTIAGPLCFAGDVIARSRLLPAIEEGDWVLIHDAGAYTLGMWSRHCSRGIPPVIGYDRAAQGDDVAFRTLRKRETPEDVVAFWSA